MRAREFTINIPITITLNGDNDPVISTGADTDSGDKKDLNPVLMAPVETPGSDQNLGDEKDLNPVMMAPLQQQLELEKAALGKKSPIINKLVATSNVGNEEQDPVERIKELFSHKMKLNQQ